MYLARKFLSFQDGCTKAQGAVQIIRYGETGEERGAEAYFRNETACSYPTPMHSVVAQVENILDIDLSEVNRGPFVELTLYLLYVEEFVRRRVRSAVFVCFVGVF